MDPESIFFTQSGISGFFRNGMAIESVMYDAIDLQTWHLPPIRITQVGQRWYSLDNRRLVVAKLMRGYGFMTEAPCRNVGECEKELQWKHSDRFD